MFGTLRYKIYRLDLPTKLHRWLSDFLVRRVIQVKTEGFLSPEYLRRDLDKLARWCATWRIKLNLEKTKVVIFSKSRSSIRAELALSLYGDFLSYYPHIKFLGITFDNRMAGFHKTFWGNFRTLQQKISSLRILVNKNWVPSIKFLGITFDNRMTFTKHFEEILERCNKKFHR